MNHRSNMDYVQMATEAGVPQAVYPEGGLMADGRLRPPKLGLLDYMSKRDIDFRRLPEEERHREVERVAAQLMAAIASIIPVLPVSLVATALLQDRDTPLSELELKSAVCQLVARLERQGAHIYVPRGDLDYAVGVGLRMLRLRRMVEEQDGLFRIRAAESALLAYYANAIEPLVSAAAMPGGPAIGKAA